VSAVPALRSLLLLALLLSPATLAWAQVGTPPPLDSEVFVIGRKLRCPACTAESVADSNAQIAVRMREEIQQLLDEGQSEREIIAYFQGIYGDFVLLEPPRRGALLWVWLLPVAALALGAVALVVYLRRWTRSNSSTPQVSDEELARVRAAMAEAEPPP
jgi:cytochrome c-type biogenesis protein CcmH